MDPVNFVAHMLPKIEYTEMKRSVTFSIEGPGSEQDYAECCDEFAHYVSQCNAIILNDEILYNSYEAKSTGDAIQDDMIRSQIMNDPHSFFAKLFQKRVAARVILYMSAESPRFVALYYRANVGMITFEFYKSNPL